MRASFAAQSNITVTIVAGCRRVDKLFARQIAKAAQPSGAVDLDVLGQLVEQAYEQADRDRLDTDRSISLMIEELDQLNRGLERLVEERTVTLRERESQLQAQNMRFNAAINNMSQALLMFDASQHLVICNERYLRLYGLSPEIVKPGCTLRQLLEHRKETGTLGDDIEEYIERAGVGDCPASDHEPADRAAGWPRHLDRQSSDDGRRLGGDPRGHHRAPARREADRAHGATRLR